MLGVTLTAMLIACSGIASAQVALEGTRVVYPAGQPTVSVLLKNGPDRASLVQAWVADGDADQSPEASSAPFVLAPPLLRLNVGESKHIRIKAIEGHRPDAAVEHLYWLNILDVPPTNTAAPDDQRVLLALRSRYKLLFRPKGVAAPGADFSRHIQFDLKEGPQPALVIHNRSPNYLNLGRVALMQDGLEQALGNPHVPPLGRVEIALDLASTDGINGVAYAWINDNGQLRNEFVPLGNAEALSPLQAD